MKENIIFKHIMVALIYAVIYHFLISDNITETIVYTLGFMILCFAFEIILKKRRENKKEVVPVFVDPDEVGKFIEAIGSRANIISASHEVSRVKVFLKDIDLIDQDKLKGLSLDGAFLSGDYLQANFGKRAEGVAQQIKQQISSNN